MPPDVPVGEQPLNAWQRYEWLWDVFYAADYVVTVALVLAQDGPLARRLVAVGALTAIGVAYLVLGRRGRRPALFCGLVLVLAVLAIVSHAAAGFGLFAACSMLFMAAPLPLAVVATVLATLSPVLSVLLQQGVDDPSLSTLVPMTGMLAVFGVCVGLWIERVLRQSRERAELIGQLEASRAEVARLSHEAGTAAERERLAREIHDTLAQGFTSIVTLLQAVESEWDDQAAARRHLALAARTARENLTEARAMVAALTPAALGTGTLAEAVRRQADRFAEETGAEVSCDVPAALPPARHGERGGAPPRGAGVAGQRPQARGGAARVRRARRGAGGGAPDRPRRRHRLRPRRGPRFRHRGDAGQGGAGRWLPDRPKWTGNHGGGGGARVISVLLVDDHPVVREGLRGMLEAEPDLTVVGEAGSGDEAVAVNLARAPDVVLMDLRMPGLDGVGATRRILADTPDRRVVVLTTYETDADILRAVEAGAAGYLLKDASRAELAGAIRAAARGETVLAPSVAGKLVARVRNPAPPPLSARETEVLRLVARGHTNAEIGRALHIGEATVKTHLLRVFGKLGVSDRTAAVTTAMARGLLM